MVIPQNWMKPVMEAHEMTMGLGAQLEAEMERRRLSREQTARDRAKFTGSE